MNLDDIRRRHMPPEPWAEGDNIPWNNPAFSERMLREHLSQAHNAASRKVRLIDEHVRFIHEELLQSRGSRILDLACGPGLYANRLAALGHEVTGIDYSPASIAYARNEAERSDGTTRFIEADVREARFGGPFDLVMMLSGEFNVFHPEVAGRLLRRSAGSLARRGALLLELSSYDEVKGKATRTHWYRAQNGLWSDRPHVCIQESHWDESSETTTVRYYVVEGETSEVRPYGVTYQAYGPGLLASIINGAGLRVDDVAESLTSEPEDSPWLVVVARKAVDDQP